MRDLVVRVAAARAAQTAGTRAPCNIALATAPARDTVRRALPHFTRYAKDLPGGEAMIRALAMLERRAGQAPSSRVAKEMVFQSAAMAESRVGRRGIKPGWSQRLEQGDRPG